MTIGASIFLIVVGAILRFAISVNNTGGVNVGLIGVILMIAGIVGLLLGIYFWSSASRKGVRSANGSSTVIEERSTTTEL